MYMPETGAVTKREEPRFATIPQLPGETRVDWMRRVFRAKSAAASSKPSHRSSANGSPASPDQAKCRPRYGGARSDRDGIHAPGTNGKTIVVTHQTVAEIAEAVGDKRLNFPAETTDAHSRGSYTGVRRPTPLRHEDTPSEGKGYLLECNAVIGAAPCGNEMQAIWGPSWPRTLFDLLVPKHQQQNFATNRDREEMIKRRTTTAKEFIRAAVTVAQERRHNSRDPVIIRRAIAISEMLTAVLGSVDKVETFVADFGKAINELDGGYDGHRALVEIWKLIPKETFSADGEVEVVTQMKPASLMPIALKAYRECYQIAGEHHT